jgi:tuberous sclerosis protein 2
MPNDPHKPQSNQKGHIGNNYVAIVYNESGHPSKMGTVKGQFNYAVIVVEPLDFESNRMSVLTKPELEAELGHMATSRWGKIFVIIKT